MLKYSTLTLLLLFLGIQSCTVTKKMHSKGYHVEFKSRIKESGKTDPNRALRAEASETTKEPEIEQTEIALTTTDPEINNTPVDLASTPSPLPVISDDTLTHTEESEHSASGDSLVYERETIIPRPIYEPDSDRRIPLPFAILITLGVVYMGYSTAIGAGVIIGFIVSLLTLDSVIFPIIFGALVAIALLSLCNYLILNLYNRKLNTYYSKSERRLAYRFYALLMSIVVVLLIGFLILMLI